MHSPLRSASLRSAVRATALTIPLALALTVPATASATPPTTWEEPPPMSTLHALLLFGGVPLGLCVLITLLTLAPSVARGGDQQRGVDRWATPQWFNGPRADAESLADDHEPQALAARTGDPRATPETDVGPARDVVPASAASGGGASARW